MLAYINTVKMRKGKVGKLVEYFKVNPNEKERGRSSLNIFQTNHNAHIFFLDI